MRVGLVCSAGGHLTQMMSLEPWFQQFDPFFITHDKPDSRSLLDAYRVYWAAGPTNRHVPNLMRNLRLAHRVLPQEQPDLLISTGAGIALPFFWWGKAHRVPLVYIEVIDRIDSPSLTGKLLKPMVDAVVLQWEEQKAFYPQGVCVGPLL